MKLFKKYAEHSRPCGRIMLLPYEYEWTYVSCGYNVIKKTRTY